MLCFADMLWEDKDFVGNSYPQEVCEGLVRSMERLSRLNPDKVIEGLSPPEFSVLCCVGEFPLKNGGRPSSVADIASMMKVSVPAVSRTLRSLQEKGWIERTVDEFDRRSVRVTLTPTGEEMMRANMKRVVEVLNRILSVFTPEEIRTISALYSKFTVSMENILGK